MSSNNLKEVIESIKMDNILDAVLNFQSALQKAVDTVDRTLDRLNKEIQQANTSSIVVKNLQKTRCCICMKPFSGGQCWYMPYHIPSEPSVHHICMALVYAMYRDRTIGELYLGAGFFTRFSLKKKYRQAQELFRKAYLDYCVFHVVDAHEFILYELLDSERKDFEARLHEARHLLEAKVT